MPEKSYTKTNWVNKQTPVNAQNMNKIEQGIADAIDGANEANNALSQKVTYQEALDILEGGQ
jgi:predicted ribonuclease toxin of YeeF-YezG toxin-antitoxin module